MNKLDLEVTSKALSDIEAITDYISKDNKRAANKFAKYLYNTFEKLTKHPMLGKTREDLTYLNALFYIVKRHYVIVYRIINNNTIRILRVLSTCQDICSEL